MTCIELDTAQTTLVKLSGLSWKKMKKAINAKKYCKAAKEANEVFEAIRQDLVAEFKAPEKDNLQQGDAGWSGFWERYNEAGEVEANAELPEFQFSEDEILHSETIGWTANDMTSFEALGILQDS